MYVLDANVFIQAKNLHYGFEFCPAFWEWLDAAHGEGRVHSVAKIRDELVQGGDELAEWASVRDSFFVEPDEEVAQSLAKLSGWAVGADYEQGAVNQFLDSGDYFLVAHAHAHGLTVVTHEVPRPESRRKIKIPDACAGNDVPYVNPFVMLRDERARFVLRPSGSRRIATTSQGAVASDLEPEEASRASSGSVDRDGDQA